jgi:4-hydroxy-2-oxoheptanedioate aldolase
MKPNKLREKLNAGEPTLGTHIHTTWPSIVEVLGHTGEYDYVEFVGEYAPFDLHDLDNLARAAELYELGSMIKVDAENRAYVSQRAVGSGFGSVLFADVRDPNEARECVRCVRPDTPDDGGTFGVEMRRFAYMGYGGTEDYAQALRDVVVVLMIEKKSAVDQLEAMLAVEGVDMVQWGGADFAMSIGKPAQYEAPEFKEAQERVFKTALEMGVPPRAELGKADDAKRFLDMGVRHFCIGTDVTVLYGYWRDQGEAMRRALEGE